MTPRRWAVLTMCGLAAGCGRPDSGSERNLDGGSDGGIATDAGLTASERACLDAGWAKVTTVVGGLQRRVLWKAPALNWPRGAVLVLHGGGGKADDFCTGGPLVQPQVAFASLAVAQGFAVFVLDSTDNVVTDSAGRPCGKRFDFSVTSRPNVDLEYIAWVGQQLLPSLRPSGSRQEVFMTGLSTGGYMAIRASTRFDGWVRAFAPVSAGDPYGTDTVCDPTLSARESAVGILVDRETGLEITLDGGCDSGGSFPAESPWETSSPSRRPPFRQFHHEADGIVDLSCMQKAQTQLVAHGYPNAGAAVVPSAGPKSAFLHLWLNVYNQPIVNYFSSFTDGGIP